MKRDGLDTCCLAHVNSLSLVDKYLLCFINFVLKQRMDASNSVKYVARHLHMLGHLDTRLWKSLAVVEPQEGAHCSKKEFLCHSHLVLGETGCVLDGNGEKARILANELDDGHAAFP